MIVPNFPGTFSAWGMLQTDLRRDLTRSYFRTQAAADMSDINSIFKELELSGESALIEDGMDKSAISYRRSADMRYSGQEYTINVALEPDTNLEALFAEFHSAHNRRYGHSNLAAPLEFVNLRVAALGTLNKYQVDGVASNSSTEIASVQRQAIFSGERMPTDVVTRDSLNPSHQLSGPVIVEEQSATTIIPPGWTAAVDDMGNLIIKRG